MSADAANMSVCATASNAGCRISAWRTHSCVPRPHSCGRLCLKCDEKSRLTHRLAGPGLAVLALGFAQSILDDLITLPGVQFPLQAPQRYSDHVAMAQLRALGGLIEFQPEVVDQIDVLRPELRRMRAQVGVHRFAPLRIHDFQRKPRPPPRQLLPTPAPPARP